MSNQKENHKKMNTALAVLSVLAIVCFVVALSTSIDTIQTFSIDPMNVGRFNSYTEIHLWVEQFRNGTLISATYHAMTITNFGKNQTRDLLGGVNANAMLYFAASADTSVFDATWTVLPAEITANGLGRALGSYILDPSGNGKWNVTYTWTATGSQATQLYGIYATAYSGATLCYAEQQGTGAVKNLLASDTLKLTGQGTST